MPPSCPAALNVYVIVITMRSESGPSATTSASSCGKRTKEGQGQVGSWREHNGALRTGPLRHNVRQQLRQGKEGRAASKRRRVKQHHGQCMMGGSDRAPPPQHPPAAAASTAGRSENWSRRDCNSSTRCCPSGRCGAPRQHPPSVSSTVKAEAAAAPPAAPPPLCRCGAARTP